MNRYSHKKVCRVIDAKSITVQLVDSTEDKVLHLTRFKSEKLQKPFFVAKDKRNNYVTTRKYRLTVIGTGPGIIHRCSAKYSGLKRTVIVRGTGPGAPFIAKGHIIAINHEVI